MLRRAGVGEMSRECLEIPDQQASLHMAELSRWLAARMAERRPEVVFTHPYEGGHPDHDACAFAVHHAVRTMKGDRRPVIVESPFYHKGQHGFAAGEFLPHPETRLNVAYALGAAEQRQKRELIECFTTQAQTLSGFGLEWERYRVAPEYDFTHPPHDPPLGYDHFPWGMSSARWCELAAEAEKELQGQAGEPEEMVAA